MRIERITVRRMNILKTALVPVLALAMGCGSDDGASDELLQDAVANYAAIVSANYTDSLTAAQDMVASLDAFVAGPSQTTLDAAKNAWLDSREPYLQTEVFRFYDGPIDNPDDGPEGFLNAWPLDEAYIDYVDGNDTAGLINSADTIDGPTLRAANEAGGEANIATGYHAIEFLLWGQDQDENGPGARPFTDYVTDGSGTAANQDRRGEYLSVVSDLLIEDLEAMQAAWAEGASNYRADFEAATPKEGLRRILTGMIILSGFETGGERLQTALDSADQEDEHSCFSDNTHRDMIQDVQGIQNVWLGSYTRLDGSTVDGVGIRDVVEAEDSDLAAQLTEKIAASLSLANALQVPFDQEIATGNDEGRARVSALVVSLQEQEALLQDVFRLFDLEVPEAE